MRWISYIAFVLALAGPVSAQPAPQPLTLLDVPFISQSEELCGGAAAAMVLRYWGERGLTAESFAHLVDRSAAGIRTASLIDDLRRRGWNAAGIAGSETALGQELARGRPVLTLIEDRPGTFHYIVVIAAAQRAIVFHDPARAPMRVMTRDEFQTRWAAAGRWMAVIVPGRAAESGAGNRDPGLRTGPLPGIVPPASTPCDRLVADGVAFAQANNLSAAEQRLTTALDCAPPAALRELAGVRLLQRRWADVEALAAAAVDLDPADTHAWRLLGTSRFVQNDRLRALEAWNRASEPRVDLIRVDGLLRTRQRIVEGYLGIEIGELLTPAAFVRARRRLQVFPAAAAASLDYVPVPSGLAELRATIAERRIPADVWSYAALGAIAVARHELEYSLPTLTAGGDRISGRWRFWPGRPHYSLTMAAPAPWGGLWSGTISWERQPFDRADLVTAERTLAQVRLSNWITPVTQVSVAGGAADWTPVGRLGHGEAALRLASRDDRLAAALAFAGWRGGSSFWTLQADLTARSSSSRVGTVFISRFSGGAATRSLPADAWFGGDVGTTRPSLLRAHPLVDDGRLKADQLGRRLVAAGGEVVHWWARPLATFGVAAFVDAARVTRRVTSGARGDVDAGAGLRLAVPLVPGTFRADLAKGLRDGATTFSFVYEP